MNLKMAQPWISVDRVESLVQLEPVLMVIGLAFAAAVIYKLFLGEISKERHRNLRRHFSNLSLHLLLAIGTFAGFYAVSRLGAENEPLLRINSYLGLISIACWTIVFVKVCRILLFEYLFISHMRVGVPLLLVNLFTLLLTILLAGWLATELFNVKLGPLLATSAIFSIVVGLALQDTLGNLFAGVAMQFDKPYEIGDWIEITINSQKWVGKVHEISWRATVLLGLSDESISVPNRLMGQTQISNFSTKARPICRSQLFRIHHAADPATAKQILEKSVGRTQGILKNPSPLAYLFESTDSWVAVKLVYFIDDYGKQFLVGDQVITAGNKALIESGFELASARMQVAADCRMQTTAQ